jgi:hypothetical protein
VKVIEATDINAKELSNVDNRLYRKLVERTGRNN